MAITIILAALILIGLAVIFGITYIRMGWKAALISTGVAFLVVAILYYAAIYVIVHSM